VKRPEVKASVTISGHDSKVRRVDSQMASKAVAARDRNSVGNLWKRHRQRTIMVFCKWYNWRKDKLLSVIAFHCILVWWVISIWIFTLSVLAVCVLRSIVVVHSTWKLSIGHLCIHDYIKPWLPNRHTRLLLWGMENMESNLNLFMTKCKVIVL